MLTAKLYKFMKNCVTTFSEAYYTLVSKDVLSIGAINFWGKLEGAVVLFSLSASEPTFVISDSKFS